MKKIEQIKELKQLYDAGALNKGQYDKLLDEIIGNSENNFKTIESDGLDEFTTFTNTIKEEYKSIKIDNQEWMIENLNIKNFRNGDPIPEAANKSDWESADENMKPAWCYYNDDPENGKKFGLLYNIYALTDKRGLIPEGWEVPSLQDYKELINHNGGNESASRNLKSRDDWYKKIWIKDPEDPLGGSYVDRVIGESGTNKSGLNIKPGGYLDEDLDGYSFKDIKDGTRLWTTKVTDCGNHNDLASIYLDGSNKIEFSDYDSSFYSYIRCIKKEEAPLIDFSYVIDEILYNKAFGLIQAHCKTVNWYYFCRNLLISRNKAEFLINKLEKEGFIGPKKNESDRRDVLIYDEAEVDFSDLEPDIPYDFEDDFDLDSFEVADDMPDVEEDF